MSPEQCKCAKSIDARSDLYSVGVTLYEMATGRLPFGRKSDSELLKAHIQETPPPPRQINPEISTQFEQIIMTAIAKPPVGRYQSAVDFRSALRQVCCPSGIPATVVSSGSVSASSFQTPIPPTEVVSPYVEGNEQPIKEPIVKKHPWAIYGGILGIVLLVVVAAVVSGILLLFAQSDSGPRSEATREAEVVRVPPFDGVRSMPSSEPAIDWWCTCYRRVDEVGGETTETACRRTTNQCEALLQKMQQEGGQAIRSCRMIRAAHPGEKTGGRELWTPSRKRGCWQVEGRCVLP